MANWSGTGYLRRCETSQLLGHGAIIDRLWSYRSNDSSEGQLVIVGTHCVDQLCSSFGRVLTSWIHAGILKRFFLKVVLEEGMNCLWNGCL